MRKLLFTAMLALAFLGCKEEKATVQIAKGQMEASLEKELQATLTEAKAEQEKATAPIPKDKLDDLVKDIENHKISDEDKAFFIGELKRAKTIMDGGIIGTAVKAVENIYRNKFISERSKPKIIAKAKQETTRGLNSKNLKTKFSVIQSLRR